ncbi:MAG: hypothetical protein IPI73_25145 [Betaproteobacteria bacterium]|nr:hypothetical protein [Betaproteobacteria bacterium]
MLLNVTPVIVDVPSRLANCMPFSLASLPQFLTCDEFVIEKVVTLLPLMQT